jgi:hypothetical protein
MTINGFGQKGSHEEQDRISLYLYLCSVLAVLESAGCVRRGCSRNSRSASHRQWLADPQ